MFLHGPTGQILNCTPPEIKKCIIADLPSFTADDDSGAGLNAKLKVRVNATDTYIIRAKSSLVTTGTYTLVVTRR